MSVSEFSLELFLRVLTKEELKDICRDWSEPVGGNKSELKDRILSNTSGTWYDYLEAFPPDELRYILRRVGITTRCKKTDTIIEDVRGKLTPKLKKYFAIDETKTSSTKKKKTIRAKRVTAKEEYPNIPFDRSYTEKMVERNIVEPILRWLGYVSGDEGFIKGKRLEIRVGTRRSEVVIPDYLLYVRSKCRVVVEVKNPRESIDNPHHIAQLFSYASHTSINAEYLFLSNGEQFRVYSCGKSKSSSNKVLLEENISNYEDWFGNLRQLIGKDVQASIVDEYRIIEEVGRGSFGVVYKVFNTEIRREEALKLVETNEPTILSRLRRSARVMNRLNQEFPESIPAIYNVNNWGGMHYVSMEYLDGVKLSEVVNDIDTFPKVRNVMYSILEPMIYAHSLGFFHRDLKPDNIICLNIRKSKIAIIDFDLAEDILGTQYTVVGTSLGTVGFAPFEQLRPNSTKRPNGKLVDVYSLGCILHYLIFNKPPEIEIDRVSYYKNELERVRLPKYRKDMLHKLLSSSTEIMPKARLESLEGFKALLDKI